jgi:uncharacterized protein (DUF2164 family)
MEIKLTKQETDAAVHSLKTYLGSELDAEPSDLQATLMLDFILKEFGPFAYNKGVADAESYFRSRLEELPSICFEHPLTHGRSKRKR